MAPLAGFEADIRARNSSQIARLNGGAIMLQQNSERALLACLLDRLHGIDADVIMGHNIANFDLDVLLHRLQFHKASSLSSTEGPGNPKADT